MKPTEMKFSELPCSVQESLLWDMELEYDGYESSKAETIHQILCGSCYCSSTNELVIENYYKALSAESLFRHILNVHDDAKRQVDACAEAMRKIGSF